MPVGLYMDVHVPRGITNSLRIRGVDVVTAQEDGADRMTDAELLSRATVLGRALFTYDDDLIVEAVRRQQAGAAFAGVAYAHPLRISIGACVRDLELIARAAEPSELEGRMEYLPLG